MKARRILIVLMICLQAFLLFSTSQKGAFPAAAVVIALIGLAWKRPLVVKEGKRVMYAFLLLLGFIMLWRVAPYDHPRGAGFVLFSVTYSFSMFFLLVQSLQFFVQSEEGVSPWIPVYGLFVMICCGNVYMTSQEERVYITSILAFSVLLVAYFMSGRISVSKVSVGRGLLSAVLIAALLAVSLAGATAFGDLMEKNELELEMMGMRFVRYFLPTPSTGGGFGDQTSLGSLSDIKLSRAMNQVSLRVFSRDYPGYMRARVYDEYVGATWKAIPKVRRLGPAVDGPKYSPPENMTGAFFQLRTEVDQVTRLMDIWPTSSIRQGMFLPTDTAHVQAPIEVLDIDAAGTTDSDDLAVGVNYVAYRDGVSVLEVSETEEELDKYMGVPEKLDVRVRYLADRIMTNAASDAERIARVVNYLAENHEYHLGVDLPWDQEPVSWFLLNQKNAHCEYFAASAAILLRLGGIPSRYVTGFVISGKNRMGGYWTARNMDAHAWVEAYIDGRGWVTVEATPPSGIPDNVGKGSAFSSMIDWVFFQLLQLQVALYNDGLAGVANWAWLRILGFLGWLGSMSLMAIVIKLLAIAYLTSMLTRAVLQRRAERPKEAYVRTLHECLARVDAALLRRYKLKRAESESITTFADRIRSEHEQFADWYERYVALRYGDARDPDDLMRFGTACDEMILQSN